MTEHRYIIKTKKYLLFLLLAILITVTYLNSEQLQQYLLSNIGVLKNLYATSPIFFSLVYAAIYILLVTLSVPVALVMSLLAGVIFSPLHAIIIISFASSIGATAAMLLARYFARPYIYAKYKYEIDMISNHLERTEKYYLFALRMSPIFPFFVINVCFGVTKIKVATFYLISQLGMLPATIIIILTGSEINRALSDDKIFSGELILYLTLLGLLPIVFRVFNKKTFAS